MKKTWSLSPDRGFAPDPAQRTLARALFATVEDAPIVAPHGHVDPSLLADPEARLGTPAELFIIPDHYVFRMLYSQGIPLQSLGIAARDGSEVERDHRAIWQRFADHFYLFRGTPTGLWLKDELINLFDVEERLDSANAQHIHDLLVAKLAQPSFTPRALFKRFNIEVLCTTDPATSDLKHHQDLHTSGWADRIRPTFRPDALLDLSAPGWRDQIARLEQITGICIGNYQSFIGALEHQRALFKRLGATATDHGTPSPRIESMPSGDAQRIFSRALQTQVTAAEAEAFHAHMLMEMARMSVEDGLVMQLHVGSFRNHNPALFEQFGPDMGADIPVSTEWTRCLRPLLTRFGNDPRFRLVLFTLDESSYSRELAPLAGHYPAVLLGPPWWFHDSVNGIRRFLDSVVETAGLQNLAGFNDDTRAFASIPARHGLWRRVTANWVAGLLVSGLIDDEDAPEMMQDLSVRLARRAYRLPEVRGAPQPA
jgi:glucuronate isomerase